MESKDDDVLSATVTSVLPDPLFTDRQVAMLAAVYAYGGKNPLPLTVIRYAKELLEFLQAEVPREGSDTQA